jgi:hypothetical protein
VEKGNGRGGGGREDEDGVEGDGERLSVEERSLVQLYCRSL